MTSKNTKFQNDPSGYNSKRLTTRSKLIRLPEVISRVGLSRSNIYMRINDETFPSPVKLGARSVAWLESAVDEWINRGA